jgi:hypothetical protein
MKRHFWVPDTQVRPGVPIDHIHWIAEAIVEYMPDEVIVGGDWWDFPSLNGHEEPGSIGMENTRYQADLDAGNEAFEILCTPMEKEIARREQKHRKRWKPGKRFLRGNHEDRADRVARNDPKWQGVIGSHNCHTRDFTVYPFLDRVWLDGVCYSHFFQNSHSKHAIGGSVDNRLNKIGASFVQGHEQGWRYGNRITGAGHTWHGVVAGSCYVHIENYRGAQGQKHWRGVVVMNEVKNGDFCIMPLTLDYLCRKYEGVSLVEYMRKKYPGNWDHLE